MSRLVCPILLTLGVAFPTATLALGLGELHVDSALHQTLVAHIDLVDASHPELVSLRASIADEDTFQRYSLDRPSFLNGITVKVGQDDQGQPILLLRSTESFTEPVVTILVDVHSSNGELIREYSVLLDPPERIVKAPASVAVSPESPVVVNSVLPAIVTSAPPVVATSAAPAAATSAAPAVVDSAPSAEVATAQDDSRPRVRSYTTSRRDTLSRVAIKAGARSRTARHKMMIAIYRANPAAFQAGPNSLHRGVVLRLPSADDLSPISSAEAEREYRVQTAAWRATDPRALRTIKHRATATASRASAAASASPSATSTPAAPFAPAPVPASVDADRVALTERVESLEKSLQAMRAELQKTQSQQQALTRQAAAALAPTPAAPETASAAVASNTSEPPASAPTTDDDEPVPQLLSRLPFYRRAPIMTALVGLGLVVAMAALVMRRRRRDDDEPSSEATYKPMSAPAAPHRAPAPAVLRESASTAAAEASRGRVTSALPTEPEASSPFRAEPERIVQAPLPTERDPAIETLLSAETSTGQTTTALPQVSLTSESLASGRFPELFSTPIEELLRGEGLLGPASPVDTGQTTQILTQRIEVRGDTVEHKFSFYNPDSHTDTTHVVMSGELNRPAPAFVERRKNPTAVLQQAIEREPNRSDLHLKLLELYYAAAAENRRAFLEAARQITQNNHLMSAEDLARISEMGRKIAPDDELFSSDLDDQAVA